MLDTLSHRRSDLPQTSPLTNTALAEQERIEIDEPSDACLTSGSPARENLVRDGRYRPATDIAARSQRVCPLRYYTSASGQVLQNTSRQSKR
jgi:hypothetical protein